jgi:ribonuclease HII
MHKALEQLPIQPEQLLIDGNRFKTYKNIPHHCIIKGDGKYASIAAASVLAKTYRDAFMLQLHTQFPNYSWDTNKGYPSKAHRERIKLHGFTPYHRKSFRCLPPQLDMDF